MLQKDGIHFGIGTKDSKSDEPEYEAQYQMFGEFVRAIQEILADWELDIHIKKDWSERLIAGENSKKTAEI